MKRLLTALLLTLLVGLPLAAEKYALLVGINDYQNDIGALKYCVADVEAFGQALIQLAAYKPRNIHLMTDRMSGPDLPEANNVILRLENLSAQLQARDSLIFYFAGHGISTPDQSYLLALDSDTASARILKRSAIPLQEVREILSEVKAQQLLTIIDACREDPTAGRSNRDNLLSQDFARAVKVQPGVGRSGQPAVSATLYACSVGERAYEWAEKGHGVFSYYLLQGLKGEAANVEGDVSINDLAAYTQQKVERWAAEEKGKKQRPWLSMEGGAKLVLVEKETKQEEKKRQPSRGEVDPETVMWKMIEETTEVSDIEDFLQAFPGGKFAAVAKLKKKQLQRQGKGGKESRLTQARPKKRVEAVRPSSVEREKKITWGKDGAKMVLIPAGSFMMGSDAGKSDEKPEHRVELDGFYMDAYEVTVGQFKKFVNQSGYRYQGDWDEVAEYSPGDNYPMIYVSWNDATAYAEWAGKRLPTEAEWEYAARGGLVGKRYPWGDEITHDDANYAGTGGKDKWSQCSPVGSFEANGYGLYDMAGNVWEWCQDRYGWNYYSSSPAKNPPGPGTGKDRVLRGGGWYSNTGRLRVANRYYYAPIVRITNGGFRCVSNLP